MAFIGVLMSLGVIAALAWVLLCMLAGGCALLIAALVLWVLCRRRMQRGEEPRRWQKIAAIVCAVAGAAMLIPVAAVWIWSAAG